jgi:hypothetical protein
VRSIVQLAVVFAVVFAGFGAVRATVTKARFVPSPFAVSKRCRRAVEERLPPYPWPLRPFDRQHPIRGYFGDPRTVIYGRRLGVFSFHNGVDIAGWPGNRVYPVVSGHVVSVRGDEIVVRSPHGRRFQYIHLRPRMRQGQYVAASRTILGYVMARWKHVHLTEIRQGCAVNPLAPGHLEPYLDRTSPRVISIVFTAPGGARLAPGGLHGEVEIVSQALDEPALPAPGVWRHMPVAPARVSWAIETASGHQVEGGVAADFERTEPPQKQFCAVYAPGTLQNFARDDGRYRWALAGRYRFRLLPGYLDTGALSNGAYTLTVTASDTAGNNSSSTVAVRVRNTARVRVLAPPPDSRCTNRTLESREHDPSRGNR